MSCGTSTIKFLLFIFNFLFTLGGIALVVIGGISLWQINNHTVTTDSRILTPSIILIVVGCAIFIVAFFGCCGSVRESHCMLMTFASLMFLLFLVTLTGGILAFVYKDKSDEIIRQGMEELRRQYGEQTPQGKLAKESWDFLQQNLKCCGVDSSLDWGLLNIPASCQCKIGSEHCALSVYSRGCYEPIINSLHTLGVLLGIFAIVLAIIQILGVIFACTLASHVKQKKSWNV